MDRDQSPGRWALALAIGLLLVGIFRPGGANTTVYIYDDNDATGGHAAGSPHTFAEIAAAFPGEFASLGTNAASYRGLQTLQIGDTGVGTATTTLSDTNSTVIWDNTKTLAWRATQTTSWNTNFGTKVGSGNQASGKNGCVLVFGALTSLRGNMAWHGSTIKMTSGALQFSNVAGTTIDMVNTLIQSSAAGVSPIVLGPASTTVNIYNVDISHTTANQVMSSFATTSAERITVCATAPTTFLQTGIPLVAVKDLKMFGTPSTSDIRWASIGPINWQLIRPGWTGAAPKFTGVSSGNPNLAAAVWEYWLWDVKVVDGAGVGIANVPVKLTDATGEVQVNTVTGSDGQLTYGSGLTANAVKVMDHYMVGLVYTQRHRSPFLVEINTGASALVGYQSRRYNFYWPGYESITTSSGSFEDVADIVSLGEPSGAGTNWTEMVL